MSEIRSVFITGVTGFVGSHLADYIAANYPETRILGLARWRSPLNNIRHIQDRINLQYGDLLDPFSIRTVFNDNKPDIVFHLAAQSYVPFSFASPVSTLSINGIGTCNLLEVIKELKLTNGYDPVIHICSSSEVYGQVRPEEVPIREDCPLRPSSPYGVSKVTEDRLAFQYWLSWGLKNIITRMFTHTGPRRGDVFALSNFAKQIAAIELGISEPVVKVGNLESVRTFSDVRDAVRAYWLLVTKCRPGEVYNIGGKETMTIGEMLNKLLELSTKKGIRVEVDPTRLRPSDVTLQIPCSDKFIVETGWEPEIPFLKTAEDTLNYWRNELKLALKYSG